MPAFQFGVARKREKFAKRVSHRWIRVTTKNTGLEKKKLCIYDGE